MANMTKVYLDVASAYAIAGVYSSTSIISGLPSTNTQLASSATASDPLGSSKPNNGGSNPTTIGAAVVVSLAVLIVAAVAGNSWWLNRKEQNAGVAEALEIDGSSKGAVQYYELPSQRPPCRGSVT